MDEAINTIGIVANTAKPHAGEVLRTLGGLLVDAGFSLVLSEDSASLWPGWEGAGKTISGVFAASDLVIVLGGDGTILATAREMGRHPRPMMGINIGSLGFLSCSNDETLEEVPGWLKNRRFRLSPRAMLDVRLFADDEQRCALIGLNEVVISRSAISRVIHLETRIDGEFLNSYSGDGLIVATPTGSTAYSLSAGGPIIDPGSGVFVITPICSHALNNRSMIVRDNVEVEIVPTRVRDEILLTVDGQSVEEVTRSARIVVRRHRHSVPLVFLPEQSFYQTLRQKLNWHGSNF